MSDVLHLPSTYFRFEKETALLAGEIYEPKRIRLIDVEEPDLNDGEGDIIFQPELGCLCGSDMLFFEADYPEFPVKVGHTLHELIGTVTATSGTRFKAGDKVLCVPENQEGLFERFRVSETRAIPLDPRPKREDALMAQPLGTVLHALRKLPNLLGQRVVVVGQGPIGQLFVGSLRNLGARQIIAIDKLPERLEVSSRMGATSMVDASSEDPVEAVRRITDGNMADVVVEAVGHREQVLNLCIDLCRRSGTILFFGVPTKVFDGIRFYDLMVKSINIQTTVNPDFDLDFPLAMQWIAERRIDVSPIITHRFPLEQLQDAFDLFLARGDGVLKPLICFPS